MIVRTYFSNTKRVIAAAYGIKNQQTLVKYVQKRLTRLTDEQLLQLGEWTGNVLLLPDQVEIIVFLLGKPEDFKVIYSEQIKD
jgi:hypothetical protein